MAELAAVDFQAKNADQQFTQSLRETGFGVLKNHPIDQCSVESIYSQWQDFFNGSDKQNYLFNSATLDGFFPASVSETAKGCSQKDIKEYFHMYPWGQVPEYLKQDILGYYLRANKLAVTLLNWIEANTPQQIVQAQSEPFSDMIAHSKQTLLRVLHYPPLQGDEEAGAIRAAAHEDINMITILPAANEPGLQVKTKNGSWMDVPCDFGNLIVNVGDMLQEASAGYYPSTTHRVINPIGKAGKRSRISLPLFLHARPEVVLSERYTAGDYLQQRLQELGVKK